MKRVLMISVVVLALTGCQSTGAYKDFLGQVESNLKRIRPKYEAGLKATETDPAIIKNDMGLIDDTIDSIDRVVKSGEAPEKGGE